MSSDATQEAVEARCVMASIAYLARNDFTKIRQYSDHLVRAKDGTREVYVWLSFDKVPTVPTELFHLAKIDKARVDVIAISIEAQDKATLRHMMNMTES